LKLFEIIIKPCSGFGTLLKGDTIFAHFCWQAAHDPLLVERGLEHQIANYSRSPLAIFSSAWPRTQDSKTPYFFKRPDIPLKYFVGSEFRDRKRKIQETKIIKKKNWITAGTDLFLNLDCNNLFSDEDLAARIDRDINNKGIGKIVSNIARSHNSIHRLTGTTGMGMFAPFETQTRYYQPGVLLSVFVLVNPEATDIDRIVTGMKRIGKWGFGKDAGTGMGRFDIQKVLLLPLPDFSSATALYTLAPCVPEQQSYRKKYFTSFVRFGKHGDILARSQNPFKNPVIMADEGAVLIPKDRDQDGCLYAGRAVTHVSRSMPETVVQGYSPVLPINLGEGNETEL
jgi:CRISPR-associated protein Csm4